MVVVATAGPAVPGLVAPQVGGGGPAELAHFLLRPLARGLNGALAEIFVRLTEVPVVSRLDIRRDLTCRGSEVAPVLLVLVEATALHSTLVRAGARAGSPTFPCDGQAVLAPVVPPHLHTGSAALRLHRVVLLLGVAATAGGVGGILPTHLHPGVASGVGVEGGAVHAVVHVVQRGVEVGHHLGVSSRESRYDREIN